MVVLVTFFEDVVEEQHHLCERFEDLFHLDTPPSFVAVDVPMGLLDEPSEGGRECDRTARKVLGRPRSSSVFSPPARSSFHCASFDEARQHGLNRQSFAILPKIRELDDIITPELQVRIREVHPEVTFFVMAGLAPAVEGKKKMAGREERARLLEEYFFQVPEGLSKFPSRKAAPDDIIDAYACVWTAMRIFRGEAGCLPDDPPLDSRGLQMGIWY
jgi:predicted RNase H-like nuclease